MMDIFSLIVVEPFQIISFPKGQQVIVIIDIRIRPLLKKVVEILVVCAETRVQVLAG